LNSRTVTKGALASLVMLLLLGGNAAFAETQGQPLAITIGGSVLNAGDQKYNVHGGSIVTATILGQTLATVATPMITSTQTFVPITLTNNQASPTPNPLQEKITWNPSTYSAFEAPDLGNVRFCSDSLCNSPLYGWLESCATSCSTGAASASAWVRLASPIAANGGTLKIFMVFLSTSTGFDTNYWGEAPNLSGSYGSFDNGAKVFNFYDNFAGTSLSNKWTPVASPGGSITVNNGVTMGASTSNDYALVVSSMQPSPSVAESYMLSRGEGTDPILGVATSTSVNNHVAFYNGFEIDRAPGTLWLSAETSSGSTNVASKSVDFHAGVWQIIWSATGSVSASDGSTTMSGTSSTPSMANYGIYLGQSTGGSGNDAARWARMRAYSPNNVLPSASFGTIATVSSSQGTASPTLNFNLQAEANGLGASGGAQFQLSGMAVSGMQVQVQGQVQIVGMQAVTLPLGCTTSCSSGIPVFFVGVAVSNVTMGSSSQLITSTMLFESPYFNPWGNPIMMVSTDGAIVIATTYDKATLDWKGTSVTGAIQGSLGNNPVQGTMTLSSNEHEDFVSGVTTYDNGTMSLTNMSPRSLNVQGTFHGTSVIPKPGSFACALTQTLTSTPCTLDCSPWFGSLGLPVIPGTCTQTGFQSTGQFSLVGQRTSDGGTRTTTVSGSYSTTWSSPALGFVSAAIATVTQTGSGD
jgi:hypothetical protein